MLDDLADAGIGGGVDIWSEISAIVEMASVIGVFFGINAPASFPPSVLAACQAVLPTPGNVHTEGAAVAAGGIQDDIDQAIGLLEAEGFDFDGIIANRSLRGKLRRARNTLGDRLEGLNPDLTEYLGEPISYPMRGLWPTGTGEPEAFVGEFGTQFVIGIRKDITVKFLDQAVIQDNTGAIIYNLPQQDMVAMRFTMRVGWQVREIGSKMIEKALPVVAVVTSISTSARPDVSVRRGARSDDRLHPTALRPRSRRRRAASQPALEAAAQPALRVSCAAAGAARGRSRASA